MKIPYGISNFATIRKGEYIYVDKTQYIPIIEKIGHYLFFIRPRRFGKTLFLSMLEHYYDINTVSLFDELFMGLYINEHPTELKNRYLILKFNFSGLNTGTEKDLRTSFTNVVLRKAILFFENYKRYFPDFEGIIEELKTAPDCRNILDILFHEVIKSDQKIYLIVDEYDHFANDIIAMGDGNYYQGVIRARSFVRDFYETIKIGTETVVERIFISGISPIMLDDLTSGFNISQNITTEPLTDTMLGFTEDELKSLIFKLSERNQDLKYGELKEYLKSYYNGYRFSEDSFSKVYNPDMILYYFNQWILYKRHPKKLVDDNVTTDYGRINQLISNKENRETLQRIIQEEGIVSELVSKFSFEMMYDQKYFVSLLFYLGLLTIKGTEYGMTSFTIPNFVIKTVYWEYISRYIKQEYNLDYNTAELQQGIWKMAYEGQIEPFVQFVSSRIIKTLSNRDLINFNEKYLKVILFSFLVPSNIYKPISEREVEGGYIDIYLEKDLRYPDVKYEWLWELKYLKESEGGQIEKVKQKGLDQIKRYAESKKLEDKVGLKKAVVVFIGKGDFVILEG